MADIHDSASRVRLLLLDVDGVLTDGKILLHADGSESKQFDIKDGTAIVWAQRSGLLVGFLSARSSAATARRAAQLGVQIVRQGVASKLDSYEQILREHALADADVAYMGDDVLDLPVLRRVGLAAAPADAADAVRARVGLVTRARGGDGAVRELVELVLKARNRWDELMSGYIAEDGRAAGPLADTRGRESTLEAERPRQPGRRAGVGPRSKKE